MRSRSSAWSLVLLLPASVLLGHVAGYGASSGHNHGGNRQDPIHDPIHAAIHGYLPHALEAATLLAVAGLLLALAAASRRPPDPHRGTGRAGLGLSGIVTVQAVAFLLLEVGERVAAGVSPTQALDSPAVAIGIAAQLATATLATFALRAARATGVRLFALPLPRHVLLPPALTHLWVVRTPAALRLAHCPGSPRAPPSR